MRVAGRELDRLHGLGKGLGYKVCYDCIGPGGCEAWCTCQSACICCHCASPADIRAEQLRLQQGIGGSLPGQTLHLELS